MLLHLVFLWKQWMSFLYVRRFVCSDEPRENHNMTLQFPSILQGFIYSPLAHCFGCLCPSYGSVLICSRKLISLKKKKTNKQNRKKHLSTHYLSSTHLQSKLLSGEIFGTINCKTTIYYLLKVVICQSCVQRIY